MTSKFRAPHCQCGGLTWTSRRHLKVHMPSVNSWLSSHPIPEVCSFTSQSRSRTDPFCSLKALLQKCGCHCVPVLNVHFPIEHGDYTMTSKLLTVAHKCLLALVSGSSSSQAPPLPHPCSLGFAFLPFSHPSRSSNVPPSLPAQGLCLHCSLGLECSFPASVWAADSSSFKSWFRWCLL